MFAIEDARKAAEAAERLDRSGLLPPFAKSGGYYMDEISVLRTEQRRRARGEDSRVVEFRDAKTVVEKLLWQSPILRDELIRKLRERAK